MWASAGAFVIIFILGLALAFTTAGAVQITGIVLVFVGMIGGLVLSVSGAGPWLRRPPASSIPPPPPPPDTAMVKCPYCGVVQPYGEKCNNCGALLPPPT